MNVIKQITADNRTTGDPLINGLSWLALDHSVVHTEQSMEWTAVPKECTKEHRLVYNAHTVDHRDSDNRNVDHKPQT